MTQKPIKRYPAHEATSKMPFKHDSILTAEFTALLSSLTAAEKKIEVYEMAIRRVIEEGVQETSGVYPSGKNNKCHHGNFGYEGCEACIEEYLQRVLLEASKLGGSDE